MICMLVLILVDRRQLDDLSLQQRECFEVLDQKVQTVIAVLSKVPTKFEEIRDLLMTEGDRTRDHVSSELQQYEKRVESKAYHQRLLDSLWFDDIHSREESIADAHAKTFEWIFENHDQAVFPWYNFVRWLEYGQGVYRITSKAGSGKSTLMNYICQDDRTFTPLRFWAGAKDVCLPKFFFWRGGSSLAKSSEGLLRSIIWQLLRSPPTCDRLHINLDAALGRQGRGAYSYNMIPAWTKRRLRNALA